MCHCKAAEALATRTPATIDHTAFKTIREVIGQYDGGQGGVQFHLHLLDFHKQRTVSVGHERDSNQLSKVDEDLTRAIVEIAAPLIKAEGSIDQALEDVAKTYDGKKLRLWADRFLRAKGQPLGKAPTRLEMCLVLQTALEQQGLEIPSTLIAASAGNHATCFRVDNYLGSCETLYTQFMRASGELGAGKEILKVIGGESLVTEQTSAFLVAEHLQFWKPHEPASAFLERIQTEPPGLAILPFKVFGQYRAAGVWFYEGKYPKGTDLDTHIANACHNATRWLGPIFDAAMLSSTNRALLDALHTSPTGSVAGCDRAQHAIMGLWCASRTTAYPPNGGAPIIEEPGGTLIGKLKKAQSKATLTFAGDAAHLLGFEKLEFMCPLTPDPKLVAKAQKAIQAELGVTRGAASSVRDLIVRRTREQTLERIDATAHDLVNALRPIISFSGDSAIAEDIDAHQRLKLIHHLSRQVEGGAWSMRRMVKNTEKAGPPLDLSSRPPTRADFEFWRDTLLTQTLACAVSHRLIYPPFPGHASILRVSFSFRVIGAGQNWEWPDENLVVDARTPIGLPSSTPSGSPPWPVSPHVRTASSNKFGEAGQLSMLMSGAVELLRNATAATCQALQTESNEGAVEVGVVFIRKRDRSRIDDQAQRAGCWLMRVTVKNPYRSRLAPPESPAAMPSLSRITEALKPIAKFRQVRSPEGVATYAYLVSLAVGGCDDDPEPGALFH